MSALTASMAVCRPSLRARPPDPGAPGPLCPNHLTWDFTGKTGQNASSFGSLAAIPTRKPPAVGRRPVFGKKFSGWRGKTQRRLAAQYLGGHEIAISMNSWRVLGIPAGRGAALCLRVIPGIPSPKNPLPSRAIPCHPFTTDDEIGPDKRRGSGRPRTRRIRQLHTGSPLSSDDRDPARERADISPRWRA